LDQEEEEGEEELDVNDGEVRRAPHTQGFRTKLIFNIFFENDFFD